MKVVKFVTLPRQARSALWISAVGFAVASLGGNAYAATASGTANATVVTPISISAALDLRFGSFSTSAAGQTVQIVANGGTRNLTGALSVGSGQNAFGAGTFSVAGDGNLTYAITLPANGVVNITTGAADASRTMAVTGFTSFPATTGALTTGAQTLAVGATITTVASQVAGVYSGTYNVSVDYN